MPVRTPRAQALRPFVSFVGLYRSDGPDRLERKIPTGAGASIEVNLAEDEIRIYRGSKLDRLTRYRGAVMGGAETLPFGIDAAETRYCAIIAFRASGLPPFVDLATDELTDQVIDLETVWGRDGSTLRDRLLCAVNDEARLDVLEAVLLARLDRPETPDPAVRVAARSLDGGASVGQAADELGLTTRALLRRYRAATGLSPKRDARVRRLHRLLRDVESPDRTDWADLAYRHGLTDQSHLVHEFTAIAGLTPTAYARHVISMTHVLEPPVG